MASCKKILMYGVFIIFSLVKGSTMNISDDFVIDPHLKNSNLRYQRLNVIKITDHPRYDVIGRNASLRDVLENAHYVCVHGKPGSSDINSLLYLIYSSLRDTSSKQHEYFFSPKICAGIAMLKDSAFYDKEDFRKAKENIFPNVKHFKDLTFYQLNILHRCFSYITASYMAEEASNIPLTLHDRQEGKDYKASPEEVIYYANMILCGEKFETDVVLLAARKRLDLNIIVILLRESENGEDSPSDGIYPEKKNVWLLRCRGFAFSPLVFEEE